jgi:hypothetical protein
MRRLQPYIKQNPCRIVAVTPRTPRAGSPRTAKGGVAGVH